MPPRTSTTTTSLMTPTLPASSAPSSMDNNNTPSQQQQLRHAPPPHRRRSGRPSDSLERLRALPPVRPIPWREGKELPPEKSTDSDRVQTRGACLLAARGVVNEPPCTHCASGAGRFSVCVFLEGFFGGACATCQMASRGNVCNLRTRAAKADGASRDTEKEKSNAQASGADAQRQEQPPQSQSQRTAPPRQSQSADWTPIEYTNPSSLKRKRETLQGTDVWRPYVSPYRPIVLSPMIVNSRTPTSAPAPTDPPLNVIYQKDDPRRRPPKFSTPQDAPSRITDSPRSRTRTSGQEISSTPQDPTTTSGRGSSSSLSPSAQLLQNQQQAQAQAQAQSQSAPHLQSPQPSESLLPPTRPPPPDTPLIDTLPRKKQKHIYSILGGLQSGIRSCLQQAESMQRQLDLLQAALGVGDEGEGEGVV